MCRNVVAAGFLLTLIASGLSVSHAEANWLSKFARTADHAHVGRVGKAASTLENVAAHVAQLPGKGPALAAELSREGHWTFVNRAGERFTAANIDEMKRVLPTIVPEAAKSDAKLTIYLTEGSLFRDRTRLRDLPAAADVRVLSGKTSHRLVTIGEGTPARIYVEHRPNLLLEAADDVRFAEATFQLNRSLAQSRIRVLAVDPQGPTVLTSGPRLDPATGRALIDTITPEKLVPALGTLRGQTALLVARRDGDHLVFKPGSGAERRIRWADLAAEAERWDVNLLIIRATTPNQPGARTWLWQKVDVKGLDDALANATLADVASALLPRNTPHSVTATPRGVHQTTLEISPAPGLPSSASSTTQLTEKIVGVVSEFGGHVINSGLEGTVTSRDRQRELDDRIIPGIPASIQWSYVIALLLGLFGAPVASGWWHRIWPAESRADYAGPTGYWAARSVRSLAFGVIFIPLVAIASAPIQAVRKLWDVVTAPLRVWRWLRTPRTV